MVVGISKITDVIDNIASLTSGDKTIPGVLLDLDTNLLRVCYATNQKAFIKELEVVTEETDVIGKVAVDFTQLQRAIQNCQPSGIIRVSDVQFIYKSNPNIITISVDQCSEVDDGNGNITSMKMATKSMDILWNEPTESKKTEILTRMRYDDIFQADMTDEYDTKELVDILNRTSVEKGKQIYVSTKMQHVFVSNAGHVTAVPVSKFPIDDQERDEIIQDVKNQNGEATTQEMIDKAIGEKINRVSYSICMSQAIAKSVSGILNKIDSDKVYIHMRDKYCNVFVDNDQEKLGIWFESAQSTKSHTSAMDKYSSAEYNTYQMEFIREFLENNIKSALNATKSEKVEIKVQEGEDGYELIIEAKSSASSIADTYRVKLVNLIDPTNDITTKTFTVSLKVMLDMIAQLKTDHIAFDLGLIGESTMYVRMAELDTTVYFENYRNAREAFKKDCESKGIEFTDTTPTPVDVVLGCRTGALLTKQYTILGK